MQHLTDSDWNLVAAAWLAAWRREGIKLNPDNPPSAMAWGDYPIPARQALIRTLKMTATLTSPKGIQTLRMRAAQVPEK